MGRENGSAIHIFRYIFPELLLKHVLLKHESYQFNNNMVTIRGTTIYFI